MAISTVSCAAQKLTAIKKKKIVEHSLFMSGCLSYNLK
jgi:hypothetical protein